MMAPRGIRKEDADLYKDAPWTAKDTENLHALAKRFETLEQMAVEYERMAWLKKKALAVFVWGLGVPTALLYFFDPIEKLAKIFTRLKGH